MRSKPNPDSRDKRELETVVKALQGSQHNPIDWIAIVRLIAPIVARIAVRYGIGLVARRLNRRVSPQVRDQIANSAADRMSEIVLKRTTSKK